LALAAAAGLVVGYLTAYAQGWLGDSTNSLANSAGPWSLAAFLVARTQRRLPWALAAAVLTLVTCELGYVLATEVRGGSSAQSTVIFWLTAAVLAGPPLGLAAHWSTRRGWQRGAGWAALGGVLAGEGWYGWATVADTTDWRYWMVEVIVGATIVLVSAARSRSPRAAAVTMAVAAATALVVFGAARLA